MLLKIYKILSIFTNRRLIKKAKGKDGLRLHLGCGNRILNGWVNIDIQWYPGVVVMRLPEGLGRFDDNSISYIYASHFLEHLEYPKVALIAVRECYRILSLGGVFRIVVPDIERIIRAYIQNNRDFFKTQKQWHPSWCTTKLEHLIYALQQNGEHKYGYDFETISKLLSQAGFSKIVKSEYKKSSIDNSAIDYKLGDVSLFVDAIK